MIAPNFMEPHAWMASAYKTALLLKTSGYDVTVLTSQTKGSKRYELVEGIPVHRVPCLFIPDPFNSAIPFSFPFHLHRLLKTFKPTHIIVNKHMFFTSLSVLQLKLYSKKVIVQTDTFPGINWFAPSRVLNGIMWLYARTLGMLVLKLADVVVLLHEGLIPTAKKIRLQHEVIHNGVDTSLFENAQPAKDIVAIKKGRLLVTYIGRLDEVKGYKTLVRAIEQLRGNTNIHFLFVCGDKDPQKRTALAKKYKGHITFLGFRTDIPNILAASDIYVMPSYMEGLPNTLMEAMAAGKACIATNVGGIKILLQNKEGVLIPRNDTHTLAAAIEKLAANKALRVRLGNHAQQRIQTSFSFGAIKKQWKKLLSSTL